MGEKEKSQVCGANMPGGTCQGVISERWKG